METNWTPKPSLCGAIFDDVGDIALTTRFEKNIKHDGNALNLFNTSMTPISYKQ
jgi:hypothetical protein